MVWFAQTLLIDSYEHHTLLEPAIDCWNVTDGIVILELGLTVRKGNWTGYFQAKFSHMLDAACFVLLSDMLICI
jgi:hypothetical protein